METARDAAGSRRLHYGYIIVVVGMLSSMGAIGLARLGYSLILPGMKDGLGLSFTETGQIATGNFIGYLVMAICGGAMAARYGPRIVISISALTGGIALILTGLAPNFWAAFLTRLVTGLGSGGMNVPMMGLLSAWFGARRRGMVSGIAVGGSSFGLILSGEYLPRLMKGELLPTLFPPGPEGWRYGWFVLGAYVIFVAVLTGLFLRNRPEELGLQPIGVVHGSPEHNMRAGVATGWRQIYRSGDLWHLAVLYMLFGFSYIVYFTFFAAHLRDRGLSLEEAGAMWGWMGWISLPSAFIWGWVSDSLGRKYGLAIVYFMLGSACLVFALAAAPQLYFLSLVLYAAGGWSIPGIMAAASGDYVPPRFAPAALGMITLIFGIGQAIGPWVAGALRDSSGSFTSSFFLAAVIALLGAFGALLLRRPKTWT
jgi:MFS family permease